MTRKSLNWLIFGGGSLIIIVVAFFTLPKLIADEMFPVPEDIVRYIEECKKELDLTDVDTALVLAIMKQESGFNPNAQSYVGAMGLGQIMPATWRGIVSREPRISDNPWDAKANTCATVYYTAGQLGAYADSPNKVELALAAYNGGGGAAAGYPNNMPGETINYVRVVAGINYPAYQSRVSDKNFVEDKEKMSALEEVLYGAVGEYLASNKGLTDRSKVKKQEPAIIQTLKILSKPFYVSI